MQVAFLLLFSPMFLVPFLTAAEPFAVEIDAVLGRCCDYGVKQAQSSNTCSSYSFNASIEISNEFLELCRDNMELCCEETRHTANCEAGKRFGKLKHNCNDKRQSAVFQLCCNACRVGQQLASINHGGHCENLPRRDQVVDQVKSDCCRDFDKDYFLLKNIDDDDSSYHDGSDYSSESCDDHSCEHKCFVRGSLAHCDCFDGFQLGNDGFSCIELRQVCEKGSKDNGRGDCEDINECDLEESFCSKYEKCVNTVGSFMCAEINICPEGFHFKEDTKRCEDIDECSQGQRCSRSEVCRNTRGSFTCELKSCRSGYSLDMDTGDCKDEDECLVLDIDCGRNRKCVNSPGSYSCECNDGFRKDSNSARTCRDIDECLEHPGICEQDCRNFVGGYRCGCKRGFIIDRNNRTCHDIDECERSGESLCPGSHCKNTVGKYKCSCPTGFQLKNERYCIDVDECQSKNACRGKNQYCLNTHGSHRCIDQSCDIGYRFKKGVCHSSSAGGTTLKEGKLDMLASPAGVCHLMDLSLCYENSNEIEGPCKLPLNYGFTFGIFLDRNTSIDGGQGLYHLKLKFLNISEEFDVELREFQSIPRSQNVERADESYFSFEKQRGAIIYKLLKSIEGPQDLRMRIWIKFHGNRGTYIVGQEILIVVEKPFLFS